MSGVGLEIEIEPRAAGLLDRSATGSPTAWPSSGTSVSKRLHTETIALDRSPNTVCHCLRRLGTTWQRPNAPITKSRFVFGGFCEVQRNLLTLVRSHHHL